MNWWYVYAMEFSIWGRVFEHIGAPPPPAVYDTQDIPALVYYRLPATPSA